MNVQGQPQTTETPLIALDVTGLVSTIREAVKEELQGQIQALRPMLEEQTAPQAAPAEYITREQVCGLLSVTYTTLTAWKRKGILTPCKVGGRTLYRRSDVEKAIKPQRGGRAGASKRKNKED